MELIYVLLFIIILEVSYLIFVSRQRTSVRRGDSVYVDTSALMDGRIVTAAQTGFLPSKIVVTRSVINEMQLLADQADPEKRTRARRGLDAVRELSEMQHIDVETLEDGAVGKGGVDERLIDLVKKRGGSLCTIDFNLNKAASALGVRVLNINELAGSIRMAFLPGETISMTLTQKGQSGSQGVGYLADGTMVVVDKAASKLNQTVEIEFVRSLQTAAGRMMFAKLKQSDNEQVKSTPGNKPSGRTTVTKARTTTNLKAQPSEQPAQTPKPRKAQSSRRRSGEDSLIELVNQQ